jgi:hypothetical protein
MRWIAGWMLLRAVAAPICEVGYAHLSVGSTVARTGDLVQVTIRNPYGNDPSYTQTALGVFKGATADGQAIQFASGKTVPKAAVEGPLTVVKPGQEVIVSVRSLEFARVNRYLVTYRGTSADGSRIELSTGSYPAYLIEGLTPVR